VTSRKLGLNRIRTEGLCKWKSSVLKVFTIHAKLVDGGRPGLLGKVER